MKKPNRKQQIIDALDAVKAKRRKDEIEAFGHPINRSSVVRNRKKYNRKKKHKNREWN